MKQVIAFIMLFLVMSVGAYAENVTEADIVEDIELPDAGTTPDSPFYGLELAIERIQLALERDPAKRAERALMHAEERLAEVQEMVEANKLEAAERAQARHTELFAEIEDVVSDKDQMPAEALRNTMVLQDKVEKHRAKIEKVKISFESKDQFLEQMSQLWDQMNGDMDSIEVRIDNAREKVQVVMENNGVDVEKVRSEIQEVLDNNGVDAAEVRKEIRKKGLDRALERVENPNARERLQDARDKLDYVCPTDDQRDEMKENCEAQGFEYEMEYEDDCEFVVCQYPDDMVDDLQDMDDLENDMEDFEYMCPSSEEIDKMKADCEAQGFEYEMDFIDNCDVIICEYSEEIMEMKEEYDEMMDDVEKDMEEELEDDMEKDVEDMEDDDEKDDE